MSEVKKFKSPICHSDYTVSIEKSSVGVRLSISGEDNFLNSNISPSDAPAFMLAIGEAIDDGAKTVKDESPEGYMEAAKHYLRQAIAAIAYEADKAKEREQLEAEALELLNAHREATGNPFAESLDGLLYNAKENWLAVARRAREINKEENNA